MNLKLWIAGGSLAVTLIVIAGRGRAQAPGFVNSGPAAMAANNKSIFVVAGRQLSQFRADDLQLVKSVTLESPVPPVRGDGASGTGAFPTRDGKPDLAMMWSQGRAVGRGPVRLKTFPLPADDIGSIMPMGGMIHGHVTPSQHLGISPRERDVPTDRYPVLAPADGFIVQVQASPGNNPDPGVRGLRYQGRYWIVLEHTGTFYTYIGLIEHLEPALVTALGGEPQPGPPVMTRIPVKAGQVLGKFGGGHGIDFAAVNTESLVTTSGGSGRRAVSSRCFASSSAKRWVLSSDSGNRLTSRCATVLVLIGCCIPCGFA